MKNLTLIAMCVMLSQLAFSQGQFTVPELNQEQKQEILFNHVMAYAASGISFAKTKGTSPEEYGKYVGKLFTPFWDPAGGLPVFANQIMFILAGMYPDNEMQIVEQKEGMVQFKMKNVDIAFQNGPMLGVTYDEFIECSKGILSELAEFMNVSFSHAMVDGWYEVTIKAK